MNKQSLQKFFKEIKEAAKSKIPAAKNTTDDKEKKTPPDNDV